MTMTIDQVTSAIEDLLESSIPMKEYHITVDRNNGGATMTICRCDKQGLPHMYLMSEIFNSYSDDWSVNLDQGKLTLIVR